MTTNPDEGDLLLRVSGIVPAEDLQPFVLRLGRRAHLRGWVMNDHRGAVIRAIGTESQLVRLVHGILHDAPPSLRVRSVEVEPVSEHLIPAGDGFVGLPDEPGEFAAAPAAADATSTSGLSRVA